jgi:lipoate-protein ligase A
MQYLDLTFPNPEENLACDEALLEMAEGGECGETLRFWQPSDSFAVIGYAQSAAREVNLAACTAHDVPVMRRITGGGTVLHGPGTLCYALILSMDRPELESVTTANTWIMGQQAIALRSVLKREVEVQGHTDLALDGRKFSGNAQRRKRRFLLFHGTILLNFDLSQVERFLLFPSKQPDYRGGRAHADFLTNIHLASAVVVQSVAEVWHASDKSDTQLIESVKRHTGGRAAKYLDEAWNLRL